MADEKKIAFLIYPSKEADTGVCMESLQQICFPQGCQIEIIALPRGKGKGEAFREGQEASDAKYKIYLDAGVWVLHENLLVDMLEVFRHNPDIGS